MPDAFDLINYLQVTCCDTCFCKSYCVECSNKHVEERIRDLFLHGVDCWNGYKANVVRKE